MSFVIYESYVTSFKLIRLELAGREDWTSTGQCALNGQWNSSASISSRSRDCVDCTRITSNGQFTKSWTRRPNSFSGTDHSNSILSLPILLRWQRWCFCRRCCFKWHGMLQNFWRGVCGSSNTVMRLQLWKLFLRWHIINGWSQNSVNLLGMQRDIFEFAHAHWVRSTFSPAGACRGGTDRWSAGVVRRAHCCGREGINEQSCHGSSEKNSRTLHNVLGS